MLMPRSFDRDEYRAFPLKTAAMQQDLQPLLAQLQSVQQQMQALVNQPPPPPPAIVPGSPTPPAPQPEISGRDLQQAASFIDQAATLIRNALNKPGL